MSVLWALEEVDPVTLHWNMLHCHLCADLSSQVNLSILLHQGNLVSLSKPCASATTFPTMSPPSVSMPTPTPVDPIFFGVFAEVQRFTRMAEKLGSVYFVILFRFYLFIFSKGGREGECEREKHQCVVASTHPQPGTWRTTQACALTGNRTSNLLVLRPTLNPLSHKS